MNWNGIIVGFFTFLIIGILHPLVIKAEYLWGKNIWPVFIIAGIVSNGASLLVGHHDISTLLAVLGFSLFWSIHELFQQEKRVKKGWYPANPLKKENVEKRLYYTDER